MRRRRELTRWTDTSVAKVSKAPSSLVRSLQFLIAEDSALPCRSSVCHYANAKVFTAEEEWKDLRWKSLVGALRLKLTAEQKVHDATSVLRLPPSPNSISKTSVPFRAEILMSCNCFRYYL